MAEYKFLVDGRLKVTLVASVPLTDEPWQALAEGEVVVVMNGRIVARSAVTVNK